MENADMLICWFVVLIIYFIFSYVVAKWETISRLGFPTEMPLLYIRMPYLYRFVCYFLFALLFVLPLVFTAISNALILLLVTAAFFLSIKSRKDALKEYREILSDMAVKDSDLSFKNKINVILKKTDAEIWNEMKLNEKI